MNNITIKKADGTTAVVFVAKRGASKDQPALYTQDAVSAIALNRPRLQVSDRPAVGGKSQRVSVSFTYPDLATVNGTQVVVGNVPIDATFVIPYGVADSTISEAVSQFVNLLSAADILAAVKAGYAPR